MEFYESQINQISFPPLLTTRLLSSLAPRSLCARLAPLPLVLGSTYNHPKVNLFKWIIFVYHIKQCTSLLYCLAFALLSKVERNGKNAVSRAEWPHEEFPNFAAGLAYFLTRFPKDNQSITLLWWSENVIVVFVQGGNCPIIHSSLLCLIPLVIILCHFFCL